MDNKTTSKQLKDKVVLISSAVGSIGSEIVRQVLIFNPKNVITLDQAVISLHHLQLETDCNVTDSKTGTAIAAIRDREDMDMVF